MFYCEDDIIPAINAAEKIFGKQSQYDLERYEDMPVYYNALLVTREFGKLWSGDLKISWDGLQESLNLLSTTINQRVFFIYGDTDDERMQAGFNINGCTMYSTNDLRETDSL